MLSNQIRIHNYINLFSSVTEMVISSALVSFEHFGSHKAELNGWNRIRDGLLKGKKSDCETVKTLFLTLFIVLNVKID